MKTTLTTQETMIYKSLLQSNNKTIKELCEQNSALSLHATYKILNKLHQKGFINIIQTYPKKYEALNPNYVMTEQINKISNYFQAEFSTQSKKTFPTSLITGRKALLDKHMQLAKSSKKEILLFISGIGDFPPEVYKALQTVLSKKVAVKFIVTNDTPTLINTWQKLGAKVKIHKADEMTADFSYVIYDQKKVLLNIRTSRYKNDKISVLIENKAHAL